MTLINGGSQLLNGISKQVDHMLMTAENEVLFFKE
jgi:hypothetical protein